MKKSEGILRIDSCWGISKSDLGIKIMETPPWSIIGIQIPSRLVGMANLKVTKVMEIPKERGKNKKL